MKKQFGWEALQSNEEEFEPVEEVEEEEEEEEESEGTSQKETEEDKKAKEIAENQKKRAEKAEKENKQLKSQLEEVQNSSKSDLSTKDLYTLLEAQVPRDDIDDVVDYAKYKNISVDEALKSSVVKATLKEKSEQRQTAQATNTGKGRKGSSQTSGKELYKEFLKSGKIPENEADIEKLAEARLNARRNN